MFGLIASTRSQCDASSIGLHLTIISTSEADASEAVTRLESLSPMRSVKSDTTGRAQLGKHCEGISLCMHVGGVSVCLLGQSQHLSARYPIILDVVRMYACLHLEISVAESRPNDTCIDGVSFDLNVRFGFNPNRFVLNTSGSRTMNRIVLRIDCKRRCIQAQTFDCASPPYAYISNRNDMHIVVIVVCARAPRLPRKHSQFAQLVSRSTFSECRESCNSRDRLETASDAAAYGLTVNLIHICSTCAKTLPIFACDPFLILYRFDRIAQVFMITSVNNDWNTIQNVVAEPTYIKWVAKSKEH